MDAVTAFRAGITVLTFLVFIGIVWWAYGDRRSARFHNAAHSLLQDDDATVSPISQGRGQ